MGDLDPRRRAQALRPADRRLQLLGCGPPPDGSRVVVPCRSLTSIAAELGHERIDLLKLDIEGAEYEVLGTLLASDLRPRVLAVEFHKTPSIRPMVTTSRALRADGYVPVALRGFDVTFVRDAAP